MDTNEHDSNMQREYRAARESAAIFDRTDRGLLILHGADRRTWLHNLVTNAVSTLSEHDGNYAFAVDMRGRVQFDLNLWNLPEQLWLDLDQNVIEAAIAHLERYLITEDVHIENATTTFARLAGCGPAAKEIAARIGVGNFVALPSLAIRPTDDEHAWLVRHDFAGGPGFELIIPAKDKQAWWERLVTLGATPAGLPTLDVLRIEAGIPRLGRDIDDTVLPPETGQIERGISYHKGCYLGQEILERMRARGALARRLVRLSTADASDLTIPAMLEQAGGEVGRITSLVRHPVEPRWIGLGYLKTRVTDVSEITAGSPPRAIQIDLP